MKRPVRRLSVVGEGAYRDEAEGFLREPGNAALVSRGRPRALLIACPDGCGETLSINLDPRAGKAWRLYTRGGGVTLYPSVWRDGGCGSHFVVWRGTILWCGRFEEDNREPSFDPALEPRVLAAMDTRDPMDAEALAQVIDELEWDVARAARRLVEKGVALSRKINDAVHFIRL